MSNNTNSILIERAYELAEELTSHPAGIDKALLLAIETGDLENVQYWVTVAEGTLSAHNFYESNLIEQEEPDVD